MPPFAHNPTAVQAPDGTYLIYHIGCGTPIKAPCTDCKGGETGKSCHAPGETVACNTTTTNILWAKSVAGLVGGTTITNHLHSVFYCIGHGLARVPRARIRHYQCFQSKSKSDLRCRPRTLYMLFPGRTARSLDGPWEQLNAPIIISPTMGKPYQARPPPAAHRGVAPLRCVAGQRVLGPWTARL